LYKENYLKQKNLIFLSILILIILTACSPISFSKTERDLNIGQEKLDGFVYLYPNTDLPNLYYYHLGSNVSQQLTFVDKELYDYTVSEDGQFIFYTLIDPFGGTEIRELTLSTLDDQLLLDCGAEFCFNPVFSDKNQILLLQKIKSPVFSGIENEKTELWVYDLQTAEFQPFSGTDAFYGVFPRWNSDQTHLAVQTMNPKRIKIFDKDAHLITQFETNFLLGLVDWRPASQELFFVNEEINDDQPTTVLWNYDLLKSEFHQMNNDYFSGGEIITNFRFSPDGQLYVVGIRESAFLPSQILWVMEPKTNTLVATIGDYSKIYSNVQWNRDGDKLLFQNYDLHSEQPGTSVIIWDLITNQQQISLIDAWFPRWLP
jgi:Tol biopolymer transport system component